ncbi:MAG: phosphonate ABC transporter, permease protein PhnE [Erysipelotrichaceae bacterium]|nr:phosphonate ABC transporter, permease protein PhnE [Erysipelotrichaceae bacterium]
MTNKFSKTVSFIVIILVLYSVLSVDYSSLEYFTLSSFKNVLIGLSKPDWNYLYDGSGEDVFSLMILTINIAILGTFIGAFLAYPLSLVASKNLYSKLIGIPKFGKFVLNVLRAFPELIYAIIFVKVVGPGPFAGVLAIGVHHIGMMGKLFAEEMEASSDYSFEAQESVGASFWQTMFYSRIPQVMPIQASLILTHLEIAVRSAATLGLVGAGGIGAPLIFAIQARNWGKVSIILIAVILTVLIIDSISAKIRKNLQ